MGRLGLWEIIFIFLIVILLFGTKKLPEIGQALGKALREFRKAGKAIEDEIKSPDEKKS